MLFLTFHQHTIIDTKDAQLFAAPAACHGGVGAEQASKRKWRDTCCLHASHPTVDASRDVTASDAARNGFFAEPTTLDLLWCAIPLLSKQPFSMSTNGVFVVLHEKRGGRRGRWGLRARPGECWWAARLFGPVRRPCLVKRCQSEWRAGTDARPAGAVMQEGSHVESGLANGKWVTPSWAESAAWPRHYYLPSPCLCAHSEPH